MGGGACAAAAIQTRSTGFGAAGKQSRVHLPFYPEFRVTLSELRGDRIAKARLPRVFFSCSTRRRTRSIPSSAIFLRLEAGRSVAALRAKLFRKNPPSPVSRTLSLAGAKIASGRNAKTPNSGVRTASRDVVPDSQGTLQYAVNSAQESVSQSHMSVIKDRKTLFHNTGRIRTGQTRKNHVRPQTRLPWA